ncbi:MAG: hypothetical protein MJ085_05295 [Clostridia bacterium]|nr:hypothetical protein [Clostridia bacterium]
MREDIFRKKALKKYSPRNDYIQVSNPSVWLIIIAVIVLWVGACVWGILGRIESKVDVRATVTDGEAVCYVSEKDAYEIAPGNIVRFDGKEGTVTQLGELQPDGTYASGIEKGDFFAELVARQQLDLEQEKVGV